MMEIWTDGACVGGNPGGCGGWAVLFARDGRIISEISGAECDTTNNRMELRAAIEGLRTCAMHKPVVVSDSKYLVNGGNHWMRGWCRRGWMRGGKEIPNADLWRRIYDLTDALDATYRWVRGHDGSDFNERCDLAATTAARQLLKDLTTAAL